MSLLDNLSNYRTILYGGDNNVPKFGVQNQQQNNSLFNANQLSPSANSATIPQTQQIQPAQATAPSTSDPSTSDVPATNNQNPLTDAINNLKNARDNLNNHQSNTRLLNSQELAKSNLAILPDREQFNDNSLLKFENIRPEDWTPQQWSQLGDVYAAKAAYETHSKNADWYNNQLARTDLSDADRQKYTDARDTSLQLRENAMNSGAMTRRTALANGFDINALGMGADDNLGTSTQALDYFQQRNQQSLLKLPTPRAFNKQRRDALKKEGYSPFHALVLANEETKDYVDDASNKLLWAMQMNGTTDGVINNNGVGYLKQLLKIDPASANMFAQEYASPAQGFAAQNQTLNTLLGQQGAMDRLLVGNQAAMEQLLEKLKTSKEIAKMNDETQRYNIDTNNEYKNASLQAQIEKANAENRREMAKQQFEIQKWAANNDPQVVQYLADILFGSEETEDKQNWKRTKLNSSYKVPDTKESKKLENDIGNRLHIIRNALLNGEVDNDGNEVAKSELARLKADLRDTEKNYLGINQKVYADATIMTDYYDKLFSGQMSLWDIDDLAWRIANEGRDPDTNENGDPIWYIKMNPKDREKYDKYLAKERGYNPKKSTAKSNKPAPSSYVPSMGGGNLPVYYGNGYGTNWQN